MHVQPSDALPKIMLARYYASSQIRFIGVDPLGGRPGIPSSWNRYAYVRNNPMRFIDPDGRKVVVAKNIEPDFREAYRTSSHFREAVDNAAGRSQTTEVKSVTKVRKAKQGAQSGNEAFTGTFETITVVDADNNVTGAFERLKSGTVEVKAGTGSASKMAHGLQHFDNQAQGGPLDETRYDDEKDEDSADWQEERVIEDQAKAEDDLSEEAANKLLEANSGVVFESNKKE